MNSMQIETLLKKYRRLEGIFTGVFASNNIRLAATYPQCFVANTGRKGTVGEHWVACWAQSRERVEYFDSFGDPPPPEIQKTLSENFKAIERNKTPLQSVLTDACGPYCIAFLTLRLRCGNLQLIVQKFASLPFPERDQVVKYFVLSMPAATI
jgi:hypothetical protein